MCAKVEYSGRKQNKIQQTTRSKYKAGLEYFVRLAKGQ